MSLQHPLAQRFLTSVPSDLYVGPGRFEMGLEPALGFEGLQIKKVAFEILCCFLLTYYNNTNYFALNITCICLSTHHCGITTACRTHVQTYKYICYIPVKSSPDYRKILEPNTYKKGL